MEPMNKTKGDRVSVFTSRKSPTMLMDTVKRMRAGPYWPNFQNWIDNLGFTVATLVQVEWVPSRLQIWLVENFDHESCTLKFDNGAVVKVTEDDVGRVLGLPRGELNVPKQGDDKEIAECQAFLGLHSLDRKRLLEMILSAKSEIAFSRFFLSLCVSELIECSESEEPTDNMWSYSTLNTDKLNWCKYLLECLKRTKKEWLENKNKIFRGPIVFLALFYADMLTIMEGGRSTEPVIASWDLTKIVSLTYKEVRSGNLKVRKENKRKGKRKLEEHPSSAREQKKHAAPRNSLKCDSNSAS